MDVVDLIRDWVALVNTVWHKMVKLSGFRQSNVPGGWRKSGPPPSGDVIFVWD